MHIFFGIARNFHNAIFLCLQLPGHFVERPEKTHKRLWKVSWIFRVPYIICIHERKVYLPLFTYVIGWFLMVKLVGNSYQSHASYGVKCYPPTTTNSQPSTRNLLRPLARGNPVWPSNAKALTSGRGVAQQVQEWLSDRGCYSYGDMVEMTENN